MTLKVVICSAVALLATHAGAEEQQVLKDVKDMQNYGIGVEVVRNFKRQGIEIDLEMVIRGMKDALSGDRLLMPEKILRQTMQEFQSELRRKQNLNKKYAAVENLKKGEAFLAENKAKEGVTTLPSGMQYKVLTAGDGRKPSGDDTVECTYRGTLINGVEFDNSYWTGKPATFKVAGKGLIPAWGEALKLMPVGSKYQFFVPSRLAYGERGAGVDIGPNETLIFEVELLAIK